MKRADLATYQAKAAGRNTLRFYEPEMQVAVSARFALEFDLRQGNELKQFMLHYQPQVDNANKIIGAEALLGWKHHERGMIPPQHNLFPLLRKLA